MRILLLMQCFNPEPQIKGLAFAKRLRDLGNDVEVLTGFPNYPGGKIYAGYSIKPFQVEVVDGIRIIRVPLYPSHDTSAYRRMLSYVSFGITSFLAGLFVASRKDVIYACGVPVTVGVSALLLGKLKSIPVVYDIQDLWPDSLAATGMFNNSYGLKIVANVCKWVYKTAAHIIVQSPGVRDILLQRGVDEGKVSVIFNWCEEVSITDGISNLINLPQDAQAKSSRLMFDVLFAGNIGKAQDLDSILEAARLLSNEIVTIRFLLMGDGVDVLRLKTKVEHGMLSNVFFLPRVAMSEVGRFLQQADVLLVHLKDDPLFRITIPAKTQAYLAAGKPILMAVAGDASWLIQEAKAGICAEPSNANSIADAILQLVAMPLDDLREMGRRGQAFYWENMSLNAGARKFLDIFQHTFDKSNF